MSSLTPAEPALRYRPCVLPSGPPLVFVVVDTEEEFDWSRPHGRGHTSVTSIRRVDRAQAIFDRFGVRPTYVVDYPVASQPDGYLPLREIADSNRGQVGAHLHPWVNPPFEETLDNRNSYACNLPPALERRKAEHLVDMITASFGKRPTVYKAGRYGFGASSAAMVEQLGFDVDASINPHMDFTQDEGPSFVEFDACPFFFGKDRRLLELPCTTGYAGALGSAGRAAHRLASRPPFERLHAVGVLARLGLTNKIRLSPEGNTLREMRRLADFLFARGTRTLNLTFHSPSLVPGNTPYVRTARDLEVFLAAIDGLLDHLLGRLGGLPCTPQELNSMAQES